jgi:hypothetical protein
VQPSLSGNGRRVAYVSRDVDGVDPEGVQVRVRDLDAKTTVLASSSAGTTTEPADGISYSPALSQDGSAVAFASTATNLLPFAVETCCAAVYVRELLSVAGAPSHQIAPARTDATEIVSLAPGSEVAGGDSGLPAIDADGGFTAFQSGDAGISDLDPGTADQIYARARSSDVAVSPWSLVFSGQIGSTSPAQTVTVANAGSGAASIRDVSAPDGFVVDDGCAGRTLHRSESCAMDVRFAPDEVGALDGELTVTSEDAVRGPRTEVVRLVGTASTSTLRVYPQTITFPETGLGRRAAPVVVTASNVGGSTVAITAEPGADGGEFAVRPKSADACAAVRPEGSCRLVVTFRPLRRGQQNATIEVLAAAAGGTIGVEVDATGTVTEPTFAFSPTVAQEGRVAFVVGTGFLPRTPLRLTWSRGPISTPDVVTDAAGSFSIPAVILRGAGTGERTLTVTMRGVPGSVSGPALLVVRGSAQPPDFVARN